jgi:hypothetical protein
MKTILLIIFWSMQAAAQAAFGWGASFPSRWMAGFLIGNAIGVSSIFVLMRLYASGDAGLACALGVGGAFVAGQIALAMVGYAFLARPTNATTVVVAISADRDADAK